MNCGKSPGSLCVLLAGMLLAHSWVVANSGELQRGILNVITSPDSAVVILDDSDKPEKERTPFVNENMIPGPHRVRLISPNPIHKPASYSFQVEAKGTTVLQHDFAYRNKVFGAQHLGLSPWNMQFELGWRYLRQTGRFTGDAALEVTTTPGVPSEESRASEDFDPDSIPTSVYMPMIYRIGLPFGLETRFQFPLARTTDAAGKSAGFAFSDVHWGLKYTHVPLNAAMDLAVRLPVGKEENLSERAPGLAISLLTAQNIKDFEVFGQLGYEVLFADVNNRRLDRGDRLFVYLRPGYLIGGIFLPYLGGRVDLRLDSKDGRESLKDGGYLLTVEPGALLDFPSGWGMELGIPLQIAGKNAPKGWGIHLSLAKAFSFRSATVSTQGGGAGPYDYESRLIADPVRAPSFVLFDPTEVTNAEYREFVQKTNRESPRDPGFPGMENYFTNPLYADFPVVNVRFEDAKAYAQWRNKRLPTLEEWMREFGDQVVDKATVVCGGEAPKSALAGSSVQGVRHSIGNVAEWVETGSKNQSVAQHVGGFFGLPAERCAAPDRLSDIAAPSGARFIGFRLVKEIR